MSGQVQTTEARVIGQATRHLVECLAWECAKKMVRSERGRRAIFARLTKPSSRAKIAGGVKAKGYG